MENTTSRVLPGFLLFAFFFLGFLLGEWLGFGEFDEGVALHVVEFWLEIDGNFVRAAFNFRLFAVTLQPRGPFQPKTARRGRTRTGAKPVTARLYTTLPSSNDTGIDTINLPSYRTRASGDGQTLVEAMRRIRFLE